MSISNIYIFRHGETYYNKRKIFTGWRDSKLTDKGIKQAEKIAEMLKDKNIDVGYASDLTRSIQTLKIVLKYHPNAKIIIDPRIRERSYGVLEGKSKVKYEREHPDLYPLIHRGYDTPPPGGESLKMVEERVTPFIVELVDDLMKKPKDIAISAHGNSMRPMFKFFENLSIKEMCSIEIPQDTYFHYTIDGKGKIKVIRGILR